MPLSVMLARGGKRDSCWIRHTEEQEPVEDGKERFLPGGELLAPVEEDPLHVGQAECEPGWC